MDDDQDPYTPSYPPFYDFYPNPDSDTIPIIDRMIPMFKEYTIGISIPNNANSYLQIALEYWIKGYAGRCVLDHAHRMVTDAMTVWYCDQSNFTKDDLSRIIDELGDFIDRGCEEPKLCKLRRSMQYEIVDDKNKE